MPKVIVFEVGGAVMVSTPVQKEVSGLQIEEAAKIAVPLGVGFLIMDSEDLPYRYPQQSWEIVEDAVSVNRENLSKILRDEAEEKRNELLSMYQKATENWRTDLDLDDISDADRTNLKSWVAWRKSVEAVDTSTASEETPVEFPAPPAI
ncbi:tail fiber assembly protein [Erwinia sp. AnSW2-5]|uniref:tail fiber assembly protein n=1 Tax=Erwinia sp. AnSW2-5 TaxID=3367692 RepID=UPI00385FB928